jgi:hypothetical protein
VADHETRFDDRNRDWEYEVGHAEAMLPTACEGAGLLVGDEHEAPGDKHDVIGPAEKLSAVTLIVETNCWKS